MRAHLGAAILILATAGCSGRGHEEPEHETEQVVAEHEAATEPVDEWRDDGPTADQVPLEGDFAAEAEASINATNYAQALDALEAEMAAE